LAPVVVSAPDPPSAVDDAYSPASNPDAKALLGGDRYDDLSMAKRFYRDGNYGLAERYYRRAAESHPRDAEAWLGLAASYDRLKRFDLADRAYTQLLRLRGPTAEVLNNIGYSYMLRGDYTRANQKLREALAKDPDNPYVITNLTLLEESRTARKAIR
jgi:Flp pilus assembly protein TadD